MKGLGLAGAGIGAAAATTPVFHDLDEVSSTPSALQKRPWYVKERDFGDITSGVDWQIMEPYSEVNTMRGSRSTYMPTLISDDEADALGDAGDAQLEQWFKAGKPGYSLRDVAMADQIGSVRLSNEWNPTTNGRGRGVDTPAEQGVAPWSGTPEEATRMIQTAGRVFGALSVGVMEIDANTRKLLYSWEPGGREKITFEGDEPVETSELHQHPTRCKYVISVVNQESQELWKRNPTELMAQIRYERATHIQWRFQAFLRQIGYLCLSEGGNGTGIAPAIAIMAGQGELGRHNRLITPEYGPTVGVFRYVTDLPLAPTKPTDTGMWEFCRACEKCAEACAGGGIAFGPPSFDITENCDPWNASAGTPQNRPGAYDSVVKGGWHAAGHEAYWDDARKCRKTKMSAGNCNSGRCLAVCTFAKYNQANIHEIVKAVSGTTTAFNGFFRTMDDMFGYGLRGRAHDDYSDNAKADEATNDWWSLDHPVYGIDSTIGAEKIS